MERLKRHETFLCTLVHTTRKADVTALIKRAKPTELDIICEVIVNILNGVIQLSDDFVKKAKKYKTILRKLAKRCLKKLLRKKILLKYFTIIRDIIAAALPICGVIGALL